MARAKKENKLGVDRWTNNGYGLKLNPPTEKQKKAIEKIKKQGK